MINIGKLRSNIKEFFLRDEGIILRITKFFSRLIEKIKGQTLEKEPKTWDDVSINVGNLIKSMILTIGKSRAKKYQEAVTIRADEAWRNLSPEEKKQSQHKMMFRRYIDDLIVLKKKKRKEEKAKISANAKEGESEKDIEKYESAKADKFRQKKEKFLKSIEDDAKNKAQKEGVINEEEIKNTVRAAVDEAVDEFDRHSDNILYPNTILKAKKEYLDVIQGKILGPVDRKILSSLNSGKALSKKLLNCF